MSKMSKSRGGDLHCHPPTPNTGGTCPPIPPWFTPLTSWHDLLMCGKTTPRWTTGTLVQVASERYVLGAVQQRRATDGNVLQGMLAHLWIRQMKFNLYLAIDYCIFGNIVTSCSFRTFCCFRGYVLFNKAPLERLSKIVVGLVNKKLSYCRYS